MAKSTVRNKQFEKQLRKFLKKAKKTGDIELRKLSLFALGQVIKKSPVDQGTFRGNWNVGLNNINLSIDPNRRESQALSDGKNKISSIKSGGKINISNALPYALRLEYGWSDQAPTGVVRVTQFELLGWLRKRNKKT